MNIESIEKERKALLELLSAQHKPEQVRERTNQILEYLSNNTKGVPSGVIALALAEAADKTLFAIFKNADERQKKFSERRIILDA
jgi:hypothetical protein